MRFRAAFDPCPGPHLLRGRSSSPIIERERVLRQAPQPRASGVEKGRGPVRSPGVRRRGVVRPRGTRTAAGRRAQRRCRSSVGTHETSTSGRRVRQRFTWNPPRTGGAHTNLGFATRSVDSRRRTGARLQATRCMGIPRAPPAAVLDRYGSIVDSVLTFLAARAVEGVEEVRGDRYVRAIDGTVRSFRASELQWGDPRALAQDPDLGPVGPVPVPRALDGREIAVRAVLGQQISVAAARTHAGRLAAALGEPLERPDGSVVRSFPPTALADAPDELLAMPRTRRDAVRSLAAALADGLDPLDRAALLEVRGIGPWTVDYVAIRLGRPDVLLASDLGVRAVARRLGLPAGERDLLAYGQRWAPHRSIAHRCTLWPARSVPDRLRLSGLRDSTPRPPRVFRKRRGS